MTKFKNYITDGIRYNAQNDIDYMINLLRKDCKPFIKELKKNKILLFSGRDELENFLKRTVRQDRKPRDTPLEIHDFIDNWFYKKFGIKARSNTIFCSTIELTTAEYGESYIVFPIGNYTTISSDAITDLYIEIMDNIIKKNYPKLALNFKKTIKFFDGKDSLYQEIEKLLSGSNYKKNSIKNNTLEVMLHCKDYYLLSSNFLFDKFTEEKFINNL